MNSGGQAKGKTDLIDAIKIAIINIRAGGSGLIMGRKAFQGLINEGIVLTNVVQEIYLAK